MFEMSERKKMHFLGNPRHILYGKHVFVNRVLCIGIEALRQTCGSRSDSGSAHRTGNESNIIVYLRVKGELVKTPHHLPG